MKKPSEMSPSYLLLIVLLVFFSHRANAYTITQSFEVVNVDGTEIELYLNRFDANLGTLTSVLIDVSAPSRVWSDQFDCTSIDSFCFVRGFASLVLATGDPTTTKVYTSESFNSFLQGESKPFGVMMNPWWSYRPWDDLTSVTVTSPRILASDWWRCESNCNDSGFGYGTQTLRGSLTYLYVSVPATLALLALLALGLAALGVRRRSSAFSSIQ